MMICSFKINMHSAMLVKYLTDRIVLFQLWLSNNFNTYYLYLIIDI